MIIHASGSKVFTLHIEWGGGEYEKFSADYVVAVA